MKHSRYLLLLAMCFCFGSAFAQDTPWMYPQRDTVILMPGKGVVIYISGDTIYSRLDTANPNVYSEKRKHWFPGMEHTKGYKEASDAMDSIMTIYDMTHWSPIHQKKKHHSFNSAPMLLPGRIDTSSFQLTIDSVRYDYNPLSKVVFPLEARNHWITEPYPAWRKALWILVGAASVMAGYLLSKIKT